MQISFERNRTSTIVIMYSLYAKSYYDKAQINANLTSILSEKELTAFNKSISNNNTKH